MNSVGGCYKCTANCQTCGPSGCTQCASGYGVNSVGGCYKCPANCQTCSSSGCTQCKTGYGVNSVGDCYKCPASGCWNNEIMIIHQL